MRRCPASLLCAAEPSVCEAYVFGSYANEEVGPTSDLDVLVVRETALGIIDRVVDLKMAARSEISIDFVVVTPHELDNNFPTSSFGRTVLASAKRFRQRDRIAAARLWLSNSNTDLDVAEDLALRFASRSCFHAQQASEMALKAALFALADDHPQTHVGEQLVGG